MKDNNEFGDLLREARNASKLSAREVSEKVGVSLTFIYDIEKGRKSPKLETVTKLADLYDRPELISSFNEIHKIPIIPVLDPEVYKVFDRWRELNGDKFLEADHIKPKEIYESARDFRNMMVHGMVDDLIEKDPKKTTEIMLFLRKLAEDLTKEGDE